ncbi:hypothetical protein [Undibacterium sp. RuRC25W]|uniref:hypothetical protein n=1 Tax=Undibacterium sp. RuRC25W TaxID=3413047 RepID=UPI003BF0BFAF
MLRAPFSPSVQNRQRPAQPSHHLALMRSVFARSWKAGVALFAALSFILLISTAATHHHANSIEDQACSLCSAVSDKLDLVTPSALPLVMLHLLAYSLYANKVYDIAFSQPTLLPPSCGPPANA